MRAALALLLLAAHVRWSADAFSLPALPAGRGLGVGRLGGQAAARHVCALGPGRGLPKPDGEMKRRWGGSSCPKHAQ